MSFVMHAQPGTSSWTVLALHGTGGDERDLLPLAAKIAPDWGYLSPRGKSDEGGATRYFRRFAEGVFDVKDLREKVDELADWIRDVTGKLGIDRGRLVAVGYSNGATVGAALLLRHPGLLRGAVLLRPSVPYDEPVWPDQAGTDVLLLPGETDPIVPPAQAAELAARLTAAGANAELLTVPTGHGLTATDITATQGFLTQLAGPN